MLVPPNTVLSIMGATASGKTALAIELADRLPIDIISVDSALIYQGMDIGTAKPEPAVLEQYPHALVNILDPLQAYSAAKFQEDVDQLVQKSFVAGRLPVLVGGTALYFKAFRDGLADMPTGNAQIRNEIEQQAEQNGWASMYAELQAVDASAAGKIHPNNTRRVQRALEVHRVSGKGISEFWTQQGSSQVLGERLGCRLLECSIEPPRKILHTRIEQRFVQMLNAGFQDEVERLFQRGDLHIGLPAIRCVGYRQMWAYLEGGCTENEMILAAQAATRQLAKRQLTWLRKWPLQLRIHPETDSPIELVLKMIGSDPIVTSSTAV